MPTLTTLYFLLGGLILGAWLRGKRAIKHDKDIKAGFDKLIRSLADQRSLPKERIEREGSHSETQSLPDEAQSTQA